MWKLSLWIPNIDVILMPWGFGIFVCMLWVVMVVVVILIFNFMVMERRWSIHQTCNMMQV
jgi:hypothetical protein